MGDVKRTVDILFNGRDDLSKTVRGITSDLDKFDTAARNIAAPLAKMGDIILDVDKALGVLVAGGMALALNRAGEFNDSFAEITTLLHTTDDNLNIFREDILKYAVDSGASLSDITNATYQAISMGKDYTEALDTLSSAEQLSIAGRADLTSTTELLVGTMNAYGLATSDTQKVSDMFFTTVEKGKVTIPELAQHMAAVTNIAAAAQIPLDTMNAAIATMTANGMPAADAITSLKGVITSILKPSTEATKIAESLGIQFNAEALASKGLYGFLQDVQVATKGNVSVMGDLFGNVRGLPSALALAGSSADTFRANLDAMRNSTGATEAAYEKMVNTMEFQNQRFLNVVDISLVDIGTKLQSGYTNILSGLTDMLTQIMKSIGAGTFDPLFNLFDALSTRISDTFKGIATALPDALSNLDFTGLISAISELVDWFASLFGEMDLTKTDDLTQGLQKIVDVITAIVNITRGMAEEYLTPIIDAITSLTSATGDLGTEAQVNLGKLLGAAKLIQDMGVYLAGFLITVKDTGIDFGAMIDILIKGADILYNTVILIVDSVTLLITAHVEGLLTIVNIATLGLSDTIGNALEDVKDFNTGAFEDIKERLSNISDAFSSEASAMTTSLRGTASEAKGIINEVPDTKIIDWSVEWDKLKAADAQQQADDLAGEKTMQFIGMFNGQPIYEEVQRVAPDTKEINIQPKVDDKALKSATDQLRIQADMLDTLAEVRKIQIQADVDQVKAAFSSINTAITDTGSALAGLFSALTTPNLDLTIRWDIESQILEENRRRDQALQMQQDLIDAQVRNLDARTEAMAAGDHILKVEANGLAPYLEGLFWEIMAAIRVRVNEEMSEMLLGLGA